MRRGIVLSALVLCGLTSILCSQELDKSKAKLVVQHSRAMKPVRAKNTIDFAAAVNRDYIVELETAGFQGTLKIVRPDKNYTLYGKALTPTRTRADILNMPEGSFQIIVGGDKVFSEGTYNVSIYEVKQKK